MSRREDIPTVVHNREVHTHHGAQEERYTPTMVHRERGTPTVVHLGIYPPLYT